MFLPFLGHAAKFAWQNRYGIMRAVDMIQRGRHNRNRARNAYRRGFLRGHMRGNRRGQMRAGRYAYSQRQYRRRGRYV